MERIDPCDPPVDERVEFLPSPTPKRRYHADSLMVVWTSRHSRSGDLAARDRAILSLSETVAHRSPSIPTNQEGDTGNSVPTMRENGGRDGLTTRPGPEEGDIMTCRVARLPLALSMRIIPTVLCCECGSSNLEIGYTSKALGPHLCPSCAQSRVEWRMWKETRMRFPMKGQPVA